MRLRNRRLYFISLIILFILSASITLLYSSGLRFNKTNKSLEKVGAITLTSEPKAAVVILDGIRLNKKTPTTINNLLTNSYQLSVKKEGFYAWSKKVTVNESRITRIPTVFLLREQINIEPEKFVPTSMIFLSPNSEKIAIYSKGQIDLVKFESLENIFTVETPLELKDLIWSPDSENIILRSPDNQFQLLNINSPDQTTDFKKLFNISIQEMAWSTNENNIIYASTGSNLARINIFQNTLTFIDENQDLHYLHNNLYYLRHESFISLVDNNLESIAEIAISVDDKIKIFSSHNNILPILNTSKNELYLYNLSSHVVEKIQGNVLSTSWSTLSDELLYFNSNEIWIWEPVSQSSELIVRTSDKINLANWLLSDQYIIYSTVSNGLIILEKNGPDRNTYNIPLKNVNFLISNQLKAAIIAISEGLFYKLEFI